MLKIKLTRFGKKKEPRYRIVVNEARDKRDGQYVASLGVYQPTAKPKVLEIDLPAYEAWLKKGAQPTATVAWLYEQAKKGKGLPAKKVPKLNKKAKAKIEAQKNAESEIKQKETQPEVVSEEAQAEVTPEENQTEATSEEAQPEATPADNK